MPCRDRDAYNARRCERYRSDCAFRLKENARTRQHQREIRAAARVAALPALPAACFAGLVGLSRHQLAALQRKQVIPKFAGGRGEPKTVRTDQVFWVVVGLFVFRRQEHWTSPSIKLAVNLSKLQRFLQLVWHEPFPLTRATEGLLNYASEELASREIRANTPHEFRRMSAFLKAREALD